MKRVGYKPEYAGAIEATASTGGQLMPPVMGAAAFLMASFLGVPIVLGDDVYGNLNGACGLPATVQPSDTQTAMARARLPRSSRNVAAVSSRTGRMGVHGA